MRRSKALFISFCLFVFLCALTTAAEAQNRVFVSATQGDDINPCTPTSPCRSFAHAITVVAPKGEILAIDSGGFGPVSITGSVSIVGPTGLEASVTQGVAGQNGIDVNAPGATVVLRGLAIFGLGTGNEGINIVAASAVSVQSCNVTGFAGNGIGFGVSTTSTLSITNSNISQNAVNGISTGASSNDMGRVEIDRTRLEANGFAGLNAFEGSRGVIRDSLASGSPYGIAVQTQGAGQTSLFEIENCTVVFNTNGIAASSGGGAVTARVSSTLVAHNTTGINNFSDPNVHIWSRSNNTLEDNTTNGSFTDIFNAQ